MSDYTAEDARRDIEKVRDEKTSPVDQCEATTRLIAWIAECEIEQGDHKPKQTAPNPETHCIECGLVIVHGEIYSMDDKGKISCEICYKNKKGGVMPR